MGPAARSWYTGKENKEKPLPKKSGFLTREEMEARKRREARKDWVCNHQQESIGERYFALKQQIGQYLQEIRALWFFEPEGKEANLACQVIAITDWAVEYNEFMTHPLLEIPTELLVPYSGPRQGGDSSHLLLLLKTPTLRMSASGARPGGLTCVPSFSTLKMIWPLRRVPCTAEKSTGPVLLCCT